MRYLSLLSLVFLLAAPPVAQSWGAGPPLAVPRRDAAVALLNGEIYVMGGRDAAGEPLASVERLGAPGGWEAGASLREERYLAAAVTYQDRIVLMGGGDDDGEPLDDVEAYDPETEDWESVESMGQSRLGLSAALLRGRIYAVGGATVGGQLLTTCEAYDGSGWYDFEDWELDDGRAAFGLTTSGEVVYFAGGLGEFGPSDAMRRYTINGGTEELPPMPTARGRLTLVADGQSVYAIGGVDAENQTLDTVERFDIASQTWETVASLNTARSGAVSAYLDGTLYVIGGRDENGSLLTSVETLTVLPVDTEDAATSLGVAFGLPYPNPFAWQTTFTLRLDAPATVALRIYDVRGQVVATLADRRFGSGEHTVTWGGRSEDGRPLASGLYLARMTGGVVPVTHAVTLLR